jgi:hypothetical protein
MGFILLARPGQGCDWPSNGGEGYLVLGSRISSAELELVIVICADNEGRIVNPAKLAANPVTT